MLFSLEQSYSSLRHLLFSLPFRWSAAVNTAVTASISLAAKGCFSISPFRPRVVRISWVVFHSFGGICSALRVEVECTSIALYCVSSIRLFNFTALRTSFSWLEDLEEVSCIFFLSFLRLLF